MILSDRSIREAIAAGRIVVEPYDPDMVQPSSIDVRLDRFFRVFLNHTMGVIDVKENLEELTQLVEIADEDTPFILHPGEFVLGATHERVALPDDMVARIEGKSSLGRLGLLIHSSLPGSEEVFFCDESGLRWRRIDEIVRKRLDGDVVAFDPETFEVGYHRVTGWYEGPEDRIFEIHLGSGRSVRVTAGHNLFTLDRDGEIAKVRTGDLEEGVRVAIAGRIADPAHPTTTIDLLDVLDDADVASLSVDGPTIERAIAEDRGRFARGLDSAGVTVGYHLRRGRLPLGLVLDDAALRSQLTPKDQIRPRGGRGGLPIRFDVDSELAWLLGFYIAEGYRRRTQAVFSNTDPALLTRVEQVLHRLGVSTSRGPGSVTACSRAFSLLLERIGAGGYAAEKRVPPLVFGWPSELIRWFLSGVIDGDGCREASRTSIFTVSEALARDLLALYARVGVRAGSCRRVRGHSEHWQVYSPAREHKLLTAVPLADRLIRDLRESTGLSQTEAARVAGYRNASDLNNIERRSGRTSVRRSTLRRLRAAYAEGDDALLAKLDRAIDGDVFWDEVVAVIDTGTTEPIYDLEVRPGGRKIENFLAGRGGVLVSNTAGFIDPGFDGHITLELSNVANLPITLYPHMKIGQISFHRMDTAAEVPYGSGALGSKYQGQRGPTPSRYWENFNR